MLPDDLNAASGKEAKILDQIMDRSIRNGREILLEIVTAAAARATEYPGNETRLGRMVFTPEETERLAFVLQSSLVLGELLGRYRMRQRQARVKERMENDGIRRFADLPMPFTQIASVGIVPLDPEQAIEFFTGLMPAIGVQPLRIGSDSRRDAFTLARATTQVILRRVQAAIRTALESGVVSQGAQQVQVILDNAGVGGGNPQYAEMVFRTNIMDAYNTGSMSEIQQPDMRPFFPAWQYLGVPDGREGDDHRVHFNNYYPTSVPFADIRGPRVFNCRCTFRPVDALEWQELRRNGVDYAI